MSYSHIYERKIVTDLIGVSDFFFNSIDYMYSYFEIDTVSSFSLYEAVFF